KTLPSLNWRVSERARSIPSWEQIARPSPELARPAKIFISPNGSVCLDDVEVWQETSVLSILAVPSGLASNRIGAPAASVDTPPASHALRDSPAPKTKSPRHLVRVRLREQTQNPAETRSGRDAPGQAGP